jgi:hypothetical protein
MAAGHIRAHGTYDRSQFAWAAYVEQNAYDKVYATWSSESELREFSYLDVDAVSCRGPSFACTFNVRRIGSLPEGEQAIRQPGDRTVWEVPAL